MDLRFLLFLFAIIHFISLTLAAPRPPSIPIPGASENEIEENVVEGVADDKKVDGEIDELGLEYGRYLQEVVKALDEDPEFAKKLENITHEQIMSGHVARHIESVAPDVRNRLDELKRIELDRLRKLAMKEHELEEEIERESHDGNERRWRTTKDSDTNKRKVSIQLLDEKNAGHVDHGNPHTFEAEDLQRLIMQATKDLEELDRKRRRDFKQYEMEKEIHYRESLQNMTTEQKQEAEKKHHEVKEKHNKHPHVNHPGSKQQLEQVWQEQDHMEKQEFDPKIFFQMHDVNGDGFLDQEEVESLLSGEVQKLYNTKDPSYDKNEMIEEYHRMREHIYKEIDANHDGLISKKEFLDYTKTPSFEKDDGWKGIEEAPVYTEEELKHYEAQRQALADHYAKYGAYQMPYQPMEMHPGMMHPNDPNHPQQQQAYYYQVAHPGQMPQQQVHSGQPVQYVNIHAPPRTCTTTGTNATCSVATTTLRKWTTSTTTTTTTALCKCTTSPTATIPCFAATKSTTTTTTTTISSKNIEMFYV
ncbi:Nucleobindin-2 [Blomia tropicalis]|nr:Nucleobindin-2 [Blomia tropicalis]